jgi:hypothetical protein
LSAALLGACGPLEGDPVRIPAPDAHEFELDVYPQMLRDCGFVECHGNPSRFFRLYGPGRTRLSPDALPYDPVTPDEIKHSYDRARSMLSGAASVLDSQLLRKPLSKYSGGAEHKGTDKFGSNVYATTADPGYQKLLRWALSVQAHAADGGAP